MWNGKQKEDEMNQKHSTIVMVTTSLRISNLKHMLACFAFLLYPYHDFSKFIICHWITLKFIKIS